MIEIPVLRYIAEGERGGPVRLFAEFANGIRAQVRQVVWHSPTGLEYGYGGSGPADMALSILAHHKGADPERIEKLVHGSMASWDEGSDDERLVVRLHQKLKSRHVEPADRSEPLIVYPRELAQLERDEAIG